jgi:hypothetical protein
LDTKKKERERKSGEWRHSFLGFAVVGKYSALVSQKSVKDVLS